MKRHYFILFGLCFTLACSSPTTENEATTLAVADENPFLGKNPWPEIRQKRISQLLPQAMEAAGIDVWATICRENNNDPMALHIGGDNAGGASFYIFYQEGTTAKSIVFCSFGEVTALRDLGLHDSIVSVTRGQDVFQLAADFIAGRNPEAIGINMSASNTIADGMSKSQYDRFSKSLGANLAKKLVSSEELVYQWLSVKLPEEIEIMTKAAELTAKWEIEAYKTVVPGKTTDADLAKFLKDKMNAFGLEDAWHPDQNPNVNSGVDRGHSHATNKVIMPGDVIQTDFGVKVYGIWVSDIQRFAYVLREGEDTAPEDIQRYWDVAVRGHRIVLENMRPGVTGYELDKSQRDWMRENGSLPVPWSTGHPVGYVAHDVGPSLGGGQEGITPSGNALRKLLPGQIFAYDGFYAWPIEGGTKTISVEEMAVVTDDGAKYLLTPQDELILIK